MVSKFFWYGGWVRETYVVLLLGSNGVDEAVLGHKVFIRPLVFDSVLQEVQSRLLGKLRLILSSQQSFL